MKPMFYLFVITVIIFKLVPLYDSANVNEFKLLQCKDNKITPFKDLPKSEKDKEHQDQKLSKVQAIIFEYEGKNNKGTEEVQNPKKSASKQEFKNNYILKKYYPQISNITSLSEDHLKFLQEGIRKSLNTKYNVENNVTKYLSSDSMYKNVALPDKNYKFYSFASENFFNFRRLFGVSDDMKKSFESSSPLKKHNVKVYFTNDEKFMIQILDYDEQEVLQSILPELFKNVCQNPRSLIMKLSGLYLIEKGTFQYFVIVKPSIFPKKLEKIKEKFFLNGVNEKCPGEGNRFLDKGFNEKYKNGLKVIPSSIYENFESNLKKDCELLKSLNLTNYHLVLITVEPQEKLPVPSSSIVNAAKKFDISIIQKNDLYQNRMHVNDGKLDITIYCEINNILQKRESLEKDMNKMKLVCQYSNKSAILNHLTFADKFLKFITGKVFSPNKK